MSRPRFSGPVKPAPLREFSPFDGVLVVDKPCGPTSHDVVDAIRSVFGIRRVGHGGTLDPSATGVLVLLLGKATKLSNRFLSSDKTYEGILRLGTTTSSQDADGEILATADFSAVTEEPLREALRGLQGDSYQMPPMVSAVKVDGVPLYKHALKGKEVERKPRLIHVYEFSLLRFNAPDALFKVRCTKGTYVRTLCHDVGATVGCGAHLASLRRTQSGKFTEEAAVPLERLLEMNEKELAARVLPLANFAGIAGR